MYLKMGQQLSQKLNLSPQMLQSIHLLSLSTTEVEQAIRQELEENPVLEEKGETLDDLSSFEKNELEEDWTQYTSTTAVLSPDKKIQEYEKYTPVEESLRDHLMWQINFSHFNSEEKKILSLIVNEINEDGYLKETTNNISVENHFELKKVNELLSKLQEFDPPGVGARNLKECLLIQAKRVGEDTKDMVNMIQNHLEDLQTKNYEKIAQALNLDIEEIKYMAEIITSMEPMPGRMFSTIPTQYVVPDIYIFKKSSVKKSDGVYGVSLNEEGMPQIKIASHYTKFLSRMMSSSPSKEQKYLVEKMKRALGFIRALNQRKETILKLVHIIAEEQVEFFEKGEDFLRPLLQREMSQRIGVAVSTISRVVTNKYVHTPQGIFELKYFFGISYLNRDGKKMSAKAIKSMMKKMFDEEKAPLSDDKVAKELSNKEGLNLSRRQVARLREEMGVLPARQR